MQKVTFMVKGDAEVQMVATCGLQMRSGVIFLLL